MMVTQRDTGSPLDFPYDNDDPRRQSENSWRNFLTEAIYASDFQNRVSKVVAFRFEN